MQTSKNMDSKDIPVLDTMKSVRLTESAIMIALSTILSMITILKLPYGGTVTAFSQLPIIIIAYRHGTRWGLFTGFVHSLLQMLLGASSFSYATSIAAAIAIMFLDYIIAFTVMGFGGIFRRKISSQSTALAFGSVLVCTLRYICHVIAGATVWMGISIPSKQALAYSFAYNATYMIPETLLTVVGAIAISSLIDFRRQALSRPASVAKRPDLSIFLSGISNISIIFATIFASIKIFPVIQSEESGIDKSLWGKVDWTLVIGVVVACTAVAIILRIISNKIPQDNKISLKWLFNILPFVAVALAIALDIWMLANLLAKPALERKASSWVQIAVLSVAIIVASIIIFNRRKKKNNK